MLNKSNDDYIKSFEQRRALNLRGKVGRIIKEPIKMFCHYLFVKFIRRFHWSIKVGVNTFWGEKMMVYLPEVVSLEIFRDGYIEEGLTRMILEYLKDGMTFLDIGSHFGFFTLLASNIVGKDGQVHSFEPTLCTYNILLDNIRTKNNITANNYAAFSIDTTLSFNDYGVEYSAWNSFVQARLDEQAINKITSKKMRVRAIPLDKYVDEKGIRPDFVKIDAESAEYDVLKGMRKIIKDYRPMISLETGDKGIDNIKNSREIISYLIERGYDAYEYKDNNIVKHILRDKYSYDNIMFIPK
jgi:FkbM family methyltransferase